MAMRLLAPGAARERQRQHAEDEREAGHQDRPQADARGLERRVDHARALLLLLLGELDHQDRVLRGEAHRRQQADLQEHVVLEPAQGHREHRADEAERDHQQHRHRDRPALVERGEAQEHDQQRQRVEQRRLARRQALLVRRARPGDAGARDLGGERFHLLHRLARAEARRGLARILEGRERRRSGSLRRRRGRPADVGESGERGHLAAPVRTYHCDRSSGRARIRRVALDVDPLDPAVVDEVVDVAPAPGGRERRSSRRWCVRP